MRRSLVQLLLAVASLCLAASPAIAKKRVAIKTNASPDFLELREQSQRPLTYVFGEGEFFGDSTRGRKIADTELRSILETLAEDMVQQNFFPTTDTAAADMLIVVHWGGVEKLEDPTKLMALERAFEGLRLSAQQEAAGGGMESDPFNAYDPMQTRFDMLQHSADMTSERMSENRIAQIIGFDEELARERQKPFASTLEETLLHQLQEERYLVILMAWDNKALAAGSSKNLLWTARLSMKALGSGFEEAVALMSGAAANYYGTDSDGLKTRVYKRHEYKVEMGEIEVLESGSELEPDSSNENKPK